MTRVPSLPRVTLVAEMVDSLLASSPPRACSSLHFFLLGLELQSFFLLLSAGDIVVLDGRVMFGVEGEVALESLSKSTFINVSSKFDSSSLILIPTPSLEDEEWRGWRGGGKEGRGG